MMKFCSFFEIVGFLRGPRACYDDAKIMIFIHHWISL
jgi:hypothetical protein